MDLLEIPDQQLYLQSCIEPVLFQKILNKIDDTTEIYGDDGCIQMLVTDFDQWWPLFNRRMTFFDAEQGPQQNLSSFVDELEELAEEADIEDISLEDVLIFRILGGAHNLKIRNE